MVGINSGVAPVVRRPQGTFRFELTFEGTRDAKVRDGLPVCGSRCPAPWPPSCGIGWARQLEDSEKEAGAEG